MPTLTLKVSAELVAGLERESKARGVSKSEIARQAIEKRLKRAGNDARPSLYDQMKSGLGSMDSGVNDLATNKKHMEGFGKWKRPKQ